MNRDWLKNNITSVLAILWSLSVIAIMILALVREVKSDEKLTYVIVSSGINIALFILGYYYGSSKGTTDRTKAESDLAKMREERSQTITTATTAIETTSPAPKQSEAEAGK